MVDYEIKVSSNRKKEHDQNLKSIDSCLVSDRITVYGPKTGLYV